MRIKHFSLMTLALLMLSVVAFAQKAQSTKPVLTPYQQALQAKRTGQLTEANAAQFKFSKPGLPAELQKAKRNLQASLPVKGGIVKKEKATLLPFANAKVKSGNPRALRAARRTAATTYNFDDGSMGEWTTIDADGDGYTWIMASEMMGPSYGHNGSADAVISQSYDSNSGALSPDNYLVSPKKQLGGKIVFYACAQDASYPSEYFGVAVSTTGNTDASAFTTLQSWTMTAAPAMAPTHPNTNGASFRSPQRAQGKWYKYEVDLSAFEGQEGYVAIRHYDCTDMFYLVVDDITIVQPGEEFTGGGGEGEGEGTPAITYDFEDSSFGEWTTIDADGDGYTWELGSSPVSYLVEGANLLGKGNNASQDFVVSGSYSNVYGALNPDNYLVSPKKQLGGKIVFYACAQDASYASEVFGVAVSTTSNTDASAFTTLNSWTMTKSPAASPRANANGAHFRGPQRAQGSWYRYEYDLSAYAGQEGYVAIRHYNCSDWFLLDVDDITIVQPGEYLADDGGSGDSGLVSPPADVEPVTYYTIGGMFMVGTSSGWVDATDYMPEVQIVFDDDDVYIQGLAFWFPDGWVKGTFSGTTLTIPSGQLIGEDQYGPEYLVGSADGSTVSDIVFTYDALSATLTAETPFIVESAEEDNLEAIYSYWIAPIFSLSPADCPRVTPPTDLVTEDWTFASYFYNGDETGSEAPIKIGFDGNDVYVQGISYYLPDGWIKGTLSGDGKSITFDAPQFYGAYSSTIGLYFACYDLNTGDLATSVTVDYDATAGTITWPEDILIVENGSATELSFYGYYEEIVATVRGTAPDPQDAPASLSTTEWLFSATSLSSDPDTGDLVEDEYELPVNVGFDGSDVWVQGLCEDLPETWVKGTLSGDKVTFPTGQHFGTYAFWFWEFDYYLMGYGATGSEDIVMDYDAANKKLTMTSDTYMLINSYWLLVDPNLIFTTAELTEIPDVAATPAQPEITKASLVGTSYPNISVNIPLKDVDGNPLLSSKLSYQYYSKAGGVETPIELTTDLYEELTSNMTEIPYTFTDDWDVYNYRLYLNMDFSEWEQIGIQSIYRGGGAENRSEIFWYEMYQPGDVALTLTDGDDISAKMEEYAKANFVKPANVTLTLAEGNYTVTAPITAGGNVSITGTNATIDASGLTGSFIVLDGTQEFAQKADGTDSDHKLIGEVSVKDLTITGLTDAFIKDSQKTLLEKLTIDDCNIEMPASGKNFIDFNGKGYIGSVKVNNSTIWAKPKNTGFFAQYGSRPKNINGDWLQEFDVQNSTIVNIANGKNFCDLKQNGTAQNVYTIKNSIFVDCGKNGQVVVGFNKGQTSATPVWDVTGNTFAWGGACTNDAEISKAGKKDGEDIVKDCIDGMPEFADADNGDFTLGETTAQLAARIGDPRWLTNNLQPTWAGDVTDPIEIIPVTKSDPNNPIDLSLLLKGELEISPNPASITFKLNSDEHYTVSEPLVTGTWITIECDGEDPAIIDCSQLNKPFVMMNNLSCAMPVNEEGFVEVNNVTFKNLIVRNVKKGLFTTQKARYIVDYLNIDNCQIYTDNAINILDFTDGGVLQELNIVNSTLANRGWGLAQIYNAENSDNPVDANILVQRLNINNSTLSKMQAFKHPVSTAELQIKVLNNVIAASPAFGNSLNGGQNTIVQSNAFANPVAQDDDIWVGQDDHASEPLATGSVEGIVVFLNDFSNQVDFSLGQCNAKEAGVGDPRWLMARLYITMGMINDAKNDLSYIINEGIKKNYNMFILPEPGDDDPYLGLKTLKPIKADKPLYIKSNPKVRVFAGANAEPFIVLSDEPAVKMINDYWRLDQIRLRGLWVICMRNSIIWDNKQKYCVENLKIDNCVLSMTPIPGDIDGTPENMRSKSCKFESHIAFEQGGVKDFSIINSTVCDNKDKAVAKYFIRYNNSARLDRYGYDKDNDFQTMTYLNNTFYGMLKSDGQWGNYNGISGQKYSKFDIQKNIWYNCGKDIIRRLAGGRFGDGAPKKFDKNTYVNDGEILDESSYDDSGTALNCIPKFKFELTNTFTPDYFHYDDYTLCTGCAQLYYKAGDPRWFVNGGFADGFHWDPKTGQVEADSRDATAIDVVESKTVEDGEWYTITGVRVDKPTKGLFIHNGRKVVVK